MNTIKRLAGEAARLQVIDTPAFPTKASAPVSFGKRNKTQNFIDEAAKALMLGWAIKNDTDIPVFIAFASIASGHNVTMFSGIDALKTATGAHCVFGPGTIYTKDVEGVNKHVSVASLDSQRDIAEFVKHTAYTPLRFTKFSMNSAKNDGSKEDSNYNNRMKSFWFSPLEDTVPIDLDLRPIRQGGANFNTDMMDVDFQTQGGGFQAVMSREHAFVIQVNAGTTLTINAFVGAQMSAPQHFYRIISAADTVMAPERRAIELR